MKEITTGGTAMDYRAACDMLMAIQRDLRFRAKEDGTLPSRESDVLDASYVLLEYIAERIKEKE